VADYDNSYRDRGYRDDNRGRRDDLQNPGHNEVFSEKIRAGKRTYIFDVRSTRGNDYYITITERKRRMDGDGVQKQKIFLYKEDFNKFVEGLESVIKHVKTELMPDFDYDRFDGREDVGGGHDGGTKRDVFDDWDD
jgi:hypothetical protein